MRLTVQVTKTSRGDQDYVQILSDDAFSINVVLIADEIEVIDERVPKQVQEEESPLSKPTVLLDEFRLRSDEDHSFSDGQVFSKDGKAYEVTLIEDVDGVVRVYGVEQDG